MPHKYHAKPTVVDDIRFASQKEANRYRELRLLERGGAIVELTLQPKYDLIVNGQKVGRYTPDFWYLEKGKPIVEEIKGFRVRDYTLRRNVFKALYPDIEHREI